MTKAVIIFFIMLGVYFVLMGVFALVKFIVNKRKIAKQLKEEALEGESIDEQSKE